MYRTAYIGILSGILASECNFNWKQIIIMCIITGFINGFLLYLDEK